MVSAISFAWFADFGKFLTITQDHTNRPFDKWIATIKYKDLGIEMETVLT